MISVLFFLGSALALLARESVALFSPTVMLQTGVPSDAGGTEGDFSLGAIHILCKQCTVAINELLCLKNAGAQISMFFI